MKLISRFFDWLDRSARDARERELDRYLSDSSDLADLERRLRMIGRRSGF